MKKRRMEEEEDGGQSLCCGKEGLSLGPDSDLHKSLTGQNFCTFEDTRAPFQAAVLQEEMHGGFRVSQLVSER